ncbi:unnamed protein product [Symbiodinium natans]|uniref:PARP n=1 Tax=Symbiodinium natans TaxID=878477 RepID=A0A812UZ76_9DINO|nr:unnamed protein product [Symbiodinium natans]
MAFSAFVTALRVLRGRGEVSQQYLGRKTRLRGFFEVEGLRDCVCLYATDGLRINVVDFLAQQGVFLCITEPCHKVFCSTSVAVLQSYPCGLYLSLRVFANTGRLSEQAKFVLMLAELLLADADRLGARKAAALRDFASAVLEAPLGGVLWFIDVGRAYSMRREGLEKVSDGFSLGHHSTLISGFAAVKQLLVRLQLHMSMESLLRTLGLRRTPSRPTLAAPNHGSPRNLTAISGAFCEAQVAVLDRLMELPPPLVQTAPSQWPPMGRQDPNVVADLDAIEALYGKESVQEHADRTEITVQDLSVVIRFDSTDPRRVTARAVGSGATTGDEAVANTCFATLQRFRRGSLGVLEAVQLAATTRHADEPLPSLDSLLLASPPSRWLGLRPETAGTTLELFNPRDVAQHAAEQLHKYLSSHERFEPAGKAEIVVHERLAERFAAALALQRAVAKVPTTPSLAFHGAPGQDVLRSICRRGFLMPGDWIEGTPDFVPTAHGNVKGMGVYTSPCLDTAARYSGVYDKDGVGLVLVALVAPGVMWRERSREDTQKQIEQWFFPPAPKEGQRQGGWIFHRGAWQVAADSEKRPSADPMDLAFAPDSSALYDGAYNSRLFGVATKVSEELVLASVDQLLPLLLLPFRPRGSLKPLVAPAPNLPMQNLPGGRRRRTLCGSRVYAYPSDPLPDRSLLCCKVVTAQKPSDELWAIHVPASESDSRLNGGPTLHVLFLVDEALATSSFKTEVPTLVQTLTGQLQGMTSLVMFNSSGVDSRLCLPFAASDTFPARFMDRWAKAGARGGGNLAAGLLHASDAIISKLAKDTEAELLSAGSPWRRLRIGMGLDTVTGEGAVVQEVSFDSLGPASLQVKWKANEKLQESSKVAVVDSKAGPLLRVEWAEEQALASEFKLSADLGMPRAPEDVAADTAFVVFALSNFEVASAASGDANRLLAQVSECAAQLHCSGCRVSMMPVALGSDERGSRLAAALRALATGGTPWHQPFYGAAAPNEAAALTEKMREEMEEWSSRKARGTVAIGQLAAKHGEGFVEEPLALPRWVARLSPPALGSEASDIVQGQCLLFKGELPRREVYVGEAEHKLVFCEPPQMCFELLKDDKAGQAVVQALGRCLQLGFALEKAAQQLRSASLVALGPMRTEIKMWLDRLRFAAEDLKIQRATKELKSFARQQAPLRAALGARMRGLSCSLQRIANALSEAATLDEAAEQEPGAAAWLRRVSSMRFGARVLQRAKKNLPEDGDGITEKERWANDLQTLSKLALDSAEAAHAPCCFLTGTSFMEQLREGVGLIKEFETLTAEEAMYAIGCVGVLIRCRRSDASDVEPWLLIVEHVSTTWASSACAALALDSEPLRDEAGEVAPDVAVLDLDGSDAYRWFTNSALYKRYLAMVFARNSLCQVPGQGFVLPILVWVKTAELLINRPIKEGQEMSAEEQKWFREMVQIHQAAAAAARRAVQRRGGSVDALAGALASPDPSAALLTEADGGPQSVCLALAAVCFSEKAAPLWAKRGLERANSMSLQRAPSRSLERSSTGGLSEDAASWPKRLRRLALAMLAEAVSRGCRRLVRSLCTASKEQPPPSEDETSKKLLWDALGLDPSSIPELQDGEKEPPELAKPEGHSDDCDLDRAKRRSALLFAPQGKYFQAGLTNCTPQGIVGSLMIHMACRLANRWEGQEATSLLCEQLWKRDISMKGFVRAVMPGDANPGAVQAALYAQGLRYHSAKQRRGGLAPLSEPEAALRGLAREQRLGAYLDKLRAKLSAAAAGQRRARRSAERLVILSTFLPEHRGLPRLFSAKEISDLNAKRSPEDQLELLPTGLLKNHCSFPDCSKYLQDLRSETDRLAEASAKKGKNLVAGSRRGLFKHLAPMTWREAGQDIYIPCLHSAALGASGVLHDARRFCQRVSDKLDERVKESQAAEAVHSAGFAETLEELRQALHKRNTS